MAELIAPERSASRPILEVTVDRIWRFFCSVRAAVYEIAFLALLVLIGTLRGSSVPRQLADLLPVTEPLVRRWYAWDVFHSLLFMATLALISVAIAIGGMLNRAPGIWRVIAHPTITTTHGFLRAAEPSARFRAGHSAEEVLNQLRTVFQNRGYRLLTQRRGEEIHLYADKHRYAKLGTFPFHFALILILVGGIAGAKYGFRETEFIVPVGETRLIGHGTGLSVRLDRFTDEYNENGVAKRFTSDLVLLKDGTPVKAEAVTVNNPMTYGSVVLYQTSFGQTATVRVTDATGAILFDGPVEMGLYRSALNADAPAGLLQVPGTDVTLNLIGPDEDRYNAPEEDNLKLTSGQLYVQARRSSMSGSEQAPSAVVDQGQAVALGDIRVTFVREGRFTLLQVGRNPGIPIFVVAAIFLVGGLAATFYFPHRRVRGIVAPIEGGSLAHLAPLARRDWSGKRDFERLVDEIEERLNIARVIAAPDGVANPTSPMPPHTSGEPRPAV